MIKKYDNSKHKIRYLQSHNIVKIYGDYNHIMFQSTIYYVIYYYNSWLIYVLFNFQTYMG